MESEEQQRRSGTSGEKHAIILVITLSKAHACILGFPQDLNPVSLHFVFACRQKEKEQMEALRKHHAEEIDHHKKEIERLQKEIDRHKGKIRKLTHDD